MEDSLAYSQTLGLKRGQGEIPAPAAGSPFYVPPPSSKALRWPIAFCLFGPVLFAFVAFEFARAHEWTGLVIALAMFCVYSFLQWVRIRAILRELKRRRAGGSSGGSRNPAASGGTDDEAAEAARLRKAAWARVGRDVFPILSNPSVLKRPFDKWKDWN